MNKLLRILIRPAVIAACVLLPPAFADRGWWVIDNTYGVVNEPFEILGLFVSVAILAYWFAALRRTGGDLEKIIPPLAIGAIVFHFLYIYVNYSTMAYDYTSYEAAARNMTNGANPYDRTRYLYPPLLAQSMAWMINGISSARIYAHPNLTTLNTLFFMYQAVQLTLIYLIAEQFFAFGRALRVPAVYVGVLAVALFFVDAPLFRTVKNQQMNLIVLLAIIISFAHLGRHAIWCGLVMAVAVQLKPQGILFPAVWLLTGHRRAAVAFVAGTVALVFLQTAYDGNWTHWQQFIASLKLLPKYNDYFRNGSLFSFVSTIMKILHLNIDKANLMLFVRVCYVGIGVWLAYRYIGRERLFRAGAKQVAVSDRGLYDTMMRTCAHGADIILLALVVSPLIWEHHYVLTIPIVLWLFALTRGRMPARVVVALVLILIPSTFDVVLLSYHRLLGVALLLWTTSPGNVFAWFADARSRPYIGQTDTPS